MVKVKRIVADLSTDDPKGLGAFYTALFDLDVLMDQGWIMTLGGDAPSPVQVSLASEGGSGTPVPQLSIEVDDLDEVLRRVQALGINLVYPLTHEPWGVRRFFIADPTGRVLNILSHT
ncbi:Glyoxylase [Sulfitobacter noctilucicola]|uniref:Putative enzyme related to lactoylglutathione lyase n=1 Tax=Sulfitobacter noctilucicola TaxID=1342301 RepID=A0A7W6Q592_9RHOB|nr:VOC family protein [Sulfitobacter noctilucicola]KIN61994.1 Glyoxylase [Sulfitobacter noctilucicola]MBB4173485.1 putative enzyme related to lactoylglutathione lyase [Sulfitobacter noctilucicola]